MGERGHSHHKEVLNFTGFSSHYYGTMSFHNGYGGFDYQGDILFMNTAIFAIEPWCDQGYVNLAAATGASALGWLYFDGSMETANLKETFSFRSFMGASAWNMNAEWMISTYTYSHGALHLKGSRDFYFSQSAQTVKLGNLGKNISAFSFQLESVGFYGNTCTYDAGTTGYELAIGNVKIVWNGKIPPHQGGRHLPLPGQHAAHHPTFAAHTASHSAHANNTMHNSSDLHHTSAPYHSQLLSFGHHSGDLAQQFALPHIDHLGV
ncbi:MAG TPA: hypothetical protein VGF97_05230 [Rhizomicrobium sp.]|jgi:hypothetical protein